MSLRQSDITVPRSTLDDYAKVKADGATTFRLGVRSNDDDTATEVFLEVTGTDGPSKDDYRTCVTDNLDVDMYVHAALVHAVTGKGGRLRWVLLTWENTSSGGAEFGTADWSGVGPWVAEELGDIAKVIDHRSIDFERDDLYDTKVAPELADL
ncbi:hypothetical protein [Streptomyces sp. SID3343]|uniref:hypothetical protein n=1 Tax=Streptomyces sp. SID3343 TaxID=2690260 RepID=UPI001370E55D|nr:hypothetical protein [Streptomyces sp. SID3343]MYV97069.1 hypothetical protein [Streptomyces sp. SID3343]